MNPGAENKLAPVAVDDEEWQKEVQEDEEERVPAVQEPPKYGTDNDNADE